MNNLKSKETIGSFQGDQTSFSKNIDMDSKTDMLLDIFTTDTQRNTFDQNIYTNNILHSSKFSNGPCIKGLFICFIHQLIL